MFDHRLVLLATPRQIGVLDWRPGHMHWLGQFPATQEGLAAFREVVVRHTTVPVLLIADTVDEDYRSEVLPHVQGRGRDELLTRKLKQVFRNARFIGAWRQARETTGRRDDRYLLAALPDAEWLTPWLSVLHRERAPLAGITPLALAYQHLLEKLRPPAAHVLLACRLNSGLRLSYYQNGLLRFSRLIGGDQPSQLPDNAADEIAKTQLYLTGQRILPREARLHVLLLDPSGQLDSARTPLNADPAFSTRLIDMASLARALHIPDDFLEATPEVAPLAAIAGETLHLNLAPAELRQHHTEFLWRRYLRAAAATVALLGVTATGAYWLHAQNLRDEGDILTLQERRLEARYQAIARTFPLQTTAPEALAQTVTLAQQLGQDPVNVATLYAALGRALDHVPDIALESLGWTEDPSSGVIDITLDAALTPFSGNYRAAMQRIDVFMNELRAAPAVGAVSLRISPVDAASTSTLSGKTLDPAAPDAAARFSVSLRYREVPR